MNEVVERWLAEGKPEDKHGVPHEVKCWLVASYAERFGLKTLVETGTCHGAMVLANAIFFDAIHTIEMYPPNYEISRQRVALYPHISVYLGDSAETLEVVMGTIEEPALVFLDAHYSGGGTARGAVDTPIVRELEILGRSTTPNLILVDDRRLFAEEEFHDPVEFADYPSVDWIARFVAENFVVESDVFRDADEIVILPHEWNG